MAISSRATSFFASHTLYTTSAIEAQRLASLRYSEAFGRSFHAASTLAVVTLPGLRSESISLIVFSYSRSASDVSAGALRYFSKRLLKRRLLFMFHNFPSNADVSEPGSITGTSRPRKPGFICGGRAPPVAALESPSWPRTEAAKIAVQARVKRWGFSFTTSESPRPQEFLRHPRELSRGKIGSFED